MMQAMIQTLDQFVGVHEQMFGSAGRYCAEVVATWAPKLFAEPIDPLSLRIVLAPVEIGPYNKHIGYAATSHGLILGNRHICGFGSDNDIVLVRDEQWVADFLVHELCHYRQALLLACLPGAKVDATRGSHRDIGWYTALAEASPRYLGVEFCAPSRKSVRVKAEGYKHGKVGKVEDPDRMSESDAAHWPHSMRSLT
jgi:hypothetical protein